MVFLFSRKLYFKIIINHLFNQKKPLFKRLFFYRFKNIPTPNAPGPTWHPTIGLPGT